MSVVRDGGRGGGKEDERRKDGKKEHLFMTLKTTWSRRWSLSNWLGSVEARLGQLGQRGDGFGAERMARLVGPWLDRSFKSHFEEMLKGVSMSWMRHHMLAGWLAGFVVSRNNKGHFGKKSSCRSHTAYASIRAPASFSSPPRSDSQHTPRINQRRNAVSECEFLQLIFYASSTEKTQSIDKFIYIVSTQKFPPLCTYKT